MRLKTQICLLMLIVLLIAAGAVLSGRRPGSWKLRSFALRWTRG